MAELLIFVTVILFKIAWKITELLLMFVIWVIALTISAVVWMIERHQERNLANGAEEAGREEAFYSTRR